MILSTAPFPAAELRRTSPRAFTLIELILVMALLAVAASLAAPRMASFFQGRTLDQEARRMLSLTHYAQSRAVAESVPILLWIDAAGSRYGIEVQAGYSSDDARAVSYSVDGSLTLETSASVQPPPYEDEGITVYDTQAGILFLPDGLIDHTSVSRVVIRQRDNSAIALRATENGLGYELDSSNEATRK